MSKSQTLYLIRGLPGSGKTTMAKGLLKTIDAAHHEADHFFDELGEFRPELLRTAHQECIRRTHLDLKEGRNVIVANTFTQHWEIEPYLKLADKLKIDYEIIVATGDFKSMHNVPEGTIERMRKRWEHNVDCK